jgi:hypothetical protein
VKARKDWTHAQAWAAQRRFRANGGAAADPAGPYSQWAALHTLDEYERAFRAGDSYALMQAIRKCAQHDLAMPAWVAAAYIRAFDRVHNFRAKSWDAVFGKPLRKGTQLVAVRKKREKSVQVWNAVRAAHQRGRAIDDPLFATVGRELGIGLTLAKEYYSEVARRMPRRTR